MISARLALLKLIASAVNGLAQRCSSELSAHGHWGEAQWEMTNVVMPTGWGEAQWEMTNVVMPTGWGEVIWSQNRNHTPSTGKLR